MAKKKQPTVVEPVTRGVAAQENMDIPVFQDRYPDVVRLDPLLSSDPPVKQPVMVLTGINIFTREPSYGPAPPDPEEKWNTPGRKRYQAIEYFTGSYNGRIIKIMANGFTYLNEVEYNEFKLYFREAPNG